MFMVRKIVKIEQPDATAKIFGSFDANASMIESHFGVTLRNRADGDGDSIFVEGDDEDRVNAAVQCVTYLRELAKKTDEIPEQSVQYAMEMIVSGQGNELHELGDDCICVTARGKPIKAKTVGQKQYVDAIRKNTVTFGVGPAGTGKTFLAVAMAVKALREKQVSRVILTRPAIEAGEKLGFLPGDLQSKIDPYLRPLYDALYEMLGVETYQKLVEKGTIEIAPLAYMRGRTLDDSFIILDEAQNATPEQMKMFLTRLGANARCVVTGDISQTDLPKDKKSGLSEAIEVLRGVSGVAVVELTAKDVVRHELVQRIVRAYERYERNGGTK